MRFNISQTNLKHFPNIYEVLCVCEAVGMTMARFYESWIFEVCILSILSAQDSYGYEITKDFGLDISESAAYATLRRLEAQKLLNSYSQVHDSRMRKFYHITEAGLEALEERKTTWRTFRDNIDSILK